MVMSRAAASPGSSEISGKPSPFSHLETVRLLTWQLGRQLHLGQPQRLAVGADGAPNLFCVHICGAGTVVPALLSLVYGFIVAEREDLCNRRTVEVVHAPWNCNFFGFIPRFFFT